MNSKVKFTENEFPYSLLEKFGLTRDMINDLPVGVIESLCCGERTPLLPVQVTAEDGSVIGCRTRLSLIRTDEGAVDVLFYPELKRAKLDGFNDDDKSRLEQGKPVVGTIQLGDGKTIQGFFQLDRATKQLMSVPSPVVGRNLQLFSDRYHLTSAEINCLKQGEPLTIVDGDDTLTIGIDLMANTNVRVCPGDCMDWNERKEYNRYNFGTEGCWVMGDDGAMDYVPESEYSQEMWDEMKKHNSAMRR